jgi:hypothetical protein
VAVSFAGTTYVPNGTYTVLAREISGTQRQDTPMGSAYGGRTYSVPMYVSMLPGDQPFYRINAGGFDAFPYGADAYFSGNTGTYSTSDPVDVTGVENPAPQPVYQSELNDLTGPGGSFTYTFPKLTPGTEYRIRLHFVERYFTEAGKRTFHVAVNGAAALTHFDIFAGAGARNKALVKELTGTAKTDSTLMLTFTSVTDRALVNGIEVLETKEAVTFRRADNPGTVAKGLQYEYYEGDWKKLPDLNALPALKTGTVPGFDLSVKNRPDGFAIRYSGYVDVPRDGVYTFSLASNDGSKLFIGTRELINNDSIHDLVEKSASIGLKAGKHALSVLFFDQKGVDQLQVSYQGPGIARQPVPAGALFHAPANDAGAGKGLLAEYYNNATLAYPAVLTRIEGPVKFNWHAVSPAPGTVNKDNFSVRWTGQVQAPVTGNYAFRVPVDKGNTVRLWVNNVLLLNSWAGPAAADSAVLSLEAGGKYDLMLEYSSQKTLASLELQWAYPGQGFQTVPQNRLFPAVAGTGLQGEYFADAGFGTPTLTRIDPAIGFDWAAGSPAPAVPADNFSVRWTGTVQPRYGETYTFFLTGGQASRLWVNDRLILEKPAGTPSAPSAPVALEAGRKYKIRVEYVALTGNAAVTLAWSSPSQFRETVPTSRLYPYEDGTGLTAQYYGQMNLKDLRLTRIDPTIDFDWGGGSPAPGVIGADAYSVRWSGSVRPRHSETYTFYINSDNGRRVWVNDRLIIDQWIDNWGVTYTGTIALEANKLYKIRVEYFENFGGAGIRLEWASPSQAREVIPQSQLYPAPVFTPQFAGGVYRVEPKNAPGLRLNVAGGSSIRGANIDVTAANGSAAQDWEVTLVGGDLYEFTPLCAPDNRMDVAGARSADGTNVSTWVGYFPNNVAQQWRLIPQGDGYYALAPQNAPGSRLEVADAGTASGTNVLIWTGRTTDNDRQLWRLVPRDGSARVAAEKNSVPAGSESRLRVYPNPSAGETNISFTPQGSGAVSLHLFDARGNRVQRVFEGHAEAGVAQQHAVQGQALKDGLYMIRLNTATGTVSRKLVISK